MIKPLAIVDLAASVKLVPVGDLQKNGAVEILRVEPRLTNSFWRLTLFQAYWVRHDNS